MKLLHIKSGLLLIFAILFFAASVKSQTDIEGQARFAGGSLLIKAKESKLIVYGEVAGISSPLKNVCDPWHGLTCQMVVLRVSEVLKGSYKEKLVRINLVFSKDDRYAENREDYMGLNRTLFAEGRKLIFMFHETRSNKKGLYIGEHLQKYDDVSYLTGSINGIIQADDYEEVTLMKQFVASFTTKHDHEGKSQ